MTSSPRETSRSSKKSRRSNLSLRGHLVELRNRLAVAGIGLIVAMVIAFLITDGVIWLITEPIRVIAAERGDDAKVSLMFDTVTGAFDLRLRMAFAIGILLSAPIWLWQAWAFVVPGLTRKEIKYTIAFLGASIPLFFAGCYVGWLIMPHIVELMAGFTPDGAANYFTARYYYDFVFKLLLVIGVSFVLPVFLVALNFAGIVRGKTIFKQWRVAVLITMVFAGVATPAADIPSMLMLAGILMILYFSAAGIAVLVDRRRLKRADDLFDTSLKEV